MLRDRIESDSLRRSRRVRDERKELRARNGLQVFPCARHQDIELRRRRQLLKFLQSRDVDPGAAIDRLAQQFERFLRLSKSGPRASHADEKIGMIWRQGERML